MAKTFNREQRREARKQTPRENASTRRENASTRRERERLLALVQDWTPSPSAVALLDRGAVTARRREFA